MKPEIVLQGFTKQLLLHVVFRLRNMIDSIMTSLVKYHSIKVGFASVFMSVAFMFKF